MSFTSWLKNWRRLASSSRRHSPLRRRPDYAPPVEALECRTLLTAYAAATAAQLVADISAANKSGGANTITLTAPTTSPYVLSAVINSTDGPTALPVIKKGDNLTIVGNGNTIDAAGHGRLFDVAGGASLTLQNLTLQNGEALSAKATGNSAEGGAIFNQGTLVLSGVTVQNNTAGAVLTAGGGIWSSGSLTLENSNVWDNSAEGVRGAGGGGIWSNGSLTVENSTIWGNVAYDTWSEPAFGGGIYIASGTANITGSTFIHNAAEGSTAYGGAVYVAAGRVTLSGDTLGNISVFGNSAEGAGGQSGNYGYGGALYVAGGTVTLTNDSIQDNEAFDQYSSFGFGGGIFIASGATVYLDSFTENNTINNSPTDIWGHFILL